MVDAMKPGSIVMDLASENGGNCELTQKDEVIDHNGEITHEQTKDALTG